MLGLLPLVTLLFIPTFLLRTFQMDSIWSRNLFILSLSISPLRSLQIAYALQLGCPTHVIMAVSPDVSGLSPLHSIGCGCGWEFDNPAL